jgi:beta-galactosidase
MSFAAATDSFMKDGKPRFLISGEIHYFRLDPLLWEKHLRLLKKAGANTTSTYVPWDWHEYEEGKFDFSGVTHPARNLLRYLDLCKNIGLYLIVKPGPYILAEYESHGLPGWLLQRCSTDAFAKDENGIIIAPDVMSYLSDEFLDYTFRWYDQIMPLIARNQFSRGGPVTMMQVCNEVGVFQWLSGRIDYNPSVVRLYKQFLKEQYRDIHALNSVYGTCYAAWDEVEPPRGAVSMKQDYRAYHDFHLFYRHYFALYIDTLVRRIRAYDIDVQLTHNVPGWIFGNAAELPMLISTYTEVMKQHRDIAFGLDHIPEFVSFRNAHSDLACNKILKAMQPHGPVWAAEFQAGTREHHVKSDPNDMETFYYASLAHGLVGFNYYMFSQGINPPGKGFFGETFYFQTPLDPKGIPSSLYKVTKKFAEFIRREEQYLLSSRTRAAICVGLYKPYFYTELTTSQLLKERRLSVQKLGLTLDPRFVREEVLFNGLLRGLQTLNFNYDIHDLEQHPVAALLKYKQLWVVTTEYMDSTTQALLVEYVRKGGHLVLYPAVPTMDLYLNSCTTLRDNLDLRLQPATSPNKVDAFGLRDVYSFFRDKQEFESPEHEVVARTKTGGACGIRKAVGSGWITALGFAFGYTTDDHLRLYERIVSLDRIRRDAKVSDPEIQFVVRRGKKRSYLFLLNYHDEKKTCTVNGRRLTLKPLSCRVLSIRG